MDKIEWMKVVAKRKFTSRHRIVGREEEDRKTHGRTK